MPNAPNKVIINQRRTIGNHAAILQEYDNLRMLAEETVKRELQDETNELRDEMTAACNAHDRADETYLKKLRAIVNKWTLWLDEQAKAQE